MPFSTGDSPVEKGIFPLLLSPLRGDRINMNKISSVKELTAAKKRVRCVEQYYTSEFADEITIKLKLTVMHFETWF